MTAHSSIASRLCWRVQAPPRLPLVEEFVPPQILGHPVRVPDKDLLTRELRKLHRGRGLRSPDLQAAVGPVLRDMLGLEADELTATAVMQRLEQALRTLSPEHLLVFRYAVGALSAAPYLGQRLEEASDELRCNVRTARRRLDEASISVAQHLRSATAADIAGPLRFLTHEVTTDLRSDLVRLTSIKTARRRHGGPLTITERFGVPGLSPGVTPRPVARGASISQVRPISGSVWEASLELPEQEAGDIVSYSLAVQLSDYRDLHPFTVVVPTQSFHSCSVTVQFSERCPADSVREIRAVLPVTLYEPPTATSYTVAVDTFVLTVQRPTVHLAYGFAWRWREAPAPR